MHMQNLLLTQHTDDRKETFYSTLAGKVQIYNRIFGKFGFFTYDNT